MTIGATRLGMPPGFLNSAGQPPKPLPDTQALSSRLMVCEVHEVVAHAQAYIIRAPGMPRMTATTLADNATLFGVRDATTIVPGSFVLCYIQPDLPPIILGAIRTPVGASNQAIPDSIVSAGNTGLFENKHHQDIITSTPDAHGLINFSGGIPIDTLPGDWGKFNELGLGLFLGKFMAFLRASDVCKVEAHYLDHMLRVFAYNYQHFTAGSEEEALNDEGEFTRIRGMTPYPWEAMGVRGANASAFTPPAMVNPVNAEKLCVEPVDPMQTGFWRLRETEGFLGDLYRRTVVIPTADTMVFDPDRDEPASVGVFDEHVGIDGAFTLKSAMSILLEKTCFIPVAEPKLPRDNPEGDVVSKSGNASGVGQTIPEFPGDPDVAVLGDAIAAAEHATRAATRLREKDWLLKDENPPLVGDLDGEQGQLRPYTAPEADAPEHGEQEVDHRRTEKYYKSRARIYMTPDGGIVLEDGYGSCIRMAKGNIEISCPGDIFFRSGRDTHTMAGRDATIHANKTCDITAANEDVRIKAEQNLMVLGGNDGEGRVTVESRGEGGVAVKSVFGPIDLAGSQVGLHATGEEGGILLNANAGDADVDIVCGKLTKVLKTGSTEVVAPAMAGTPSSDLRIIQNTVDGVKIDSSTIALGAATISMFNSMEYGASTQVNLKANVRVDGRATGTSDFVESGAAEGAADAAADAAVTRRETVREDAVSPGAATPLQVLDDTLFDDSVYQATGFSYRTTYDPSRIVEATWQKRFRHTAGVSAGQDYTGTTFEFTGVLEPLTKAGQPVGEGTPTMHYPGYHAWEEASAETFVQYDDAFYDWEKGVPRPGKDLDVAGVSPAPISGPGKGRYPVNL